LLKPGAIKKIEHEFGVEMRKENEEKITGKKKIKIISRQ
jgi:hypothetical protein